MPFVSRAGQKLDHALTTFAINPASQVCADFGSNAGGFVDCLLQRGASKIYAVEKGYGVLEYVLRKNPAVVTLERTNAMHVRLPEKVDLITIDVSWTKQRNILPAVLANLKPTGQVVTLIKPHYEAAPLLLKKGVLPQTEVDQVVKLVEKDIYEAGFTIIALVTSPILGGQGNVEVLANLRPRIDHP